MLAVTTEVKNSWGAQWGEDGFVRIERGVPKDGECGIKDQPSYPIVKAKKSMVESPEMNVATAFAHFMHKFGKPLAHLHSFGQLRCGAQAFFCTHGLRFLC